MPLDRVVHWNPPESVPMWSKFTGKTRDGRLLRKVKWTEDPKDTTCNRCLQLMARDGVATV